jgi:hypothetical protein
MSVLSNLVEAARLAINRIPIFSEKDKRLVHVALDSTASDCKTYTDTAITTAFSNLTDLTFTDEVASETVTMGIDASGNFLIVNDGTPGVTVNLQADGDISILHGATTSVFFDWTKGNWSFNDNAIQAIGIGGSGAAAVATDPFIVAAEHTTGAAGGSASYSGGRITLHRDDDPSTPNKMNMSSAYGDYLGLYLSGATWGKSDAASVYEHWMQVDDGSMTITGATGQANGASLSLYGNAHSTRADMWTANAPLLMEERSAALPDLAGYGQLWIKDTSPSELWYTGDTGVDTPLVPTGWRDLRSALVGTASGAAAPSLTVFGPTGFMKQLAFGIGDSVYIAFHVDHDYKPGSIAFPHIHWTTNGTQTNSVKWQLEYTIASGHNQSSFPADTTLTVEEAAHGTAWRHMITEHPTGFSMIEPDTLILAELTRITNGGTNNTDTVFGLFVDMHYETQQYATPSRVPDFYTP